MERADARLECIDHNDLLHEPFVNRCRVRLNHESVRTAPTPSKRTWVSPLAKVYEEGGQQVVIKCLRDLLGKLGVRSTGDHYKLALTGLVISLLMVLFFPRIRILPVPERQQP